MSDEIIALVMPEVQTETPELRIAACIGQHRGDRSEQQDRVALLSSLRDPRCALAVLADGVGGVSGGALAAENAIVVSRRRFAEFDPRSGSPEMFFRALVSEIHTVLQLDGVATGLRPHTTFAALMLQPDRADWCHVGDSRIHHIRAGRVRHRSVDQKVQCGSGPQVETLGGTQTPRPECDSETGLRVEDCYLLCSDGLSNYLSDSELAAAATALAPREAVEALIDTARARARGTGDNCSLALLKLDKPLTRKPARHPGAASRPTKAPGK
jgi:serine/threonine protein phosphatase PrpC